MNLMEKKAKTTALHTWDQILKTFYDYLTITVTIKLKGDEIFQIGRFLHFKLGDFCTRKSLTYCDLATKLMTSMARTLQWTIERGNSPNISELHGWCFRKHYKSLVFMLASLHLSFH